LPGNPLSIPKSSQELRVCGDYRPFSRRYWVVGGDGMIASGEFLKSQVSYVKQILSERAKTWLVLMANLGRSKKISLPKTISFLRRKHQAWEVLISGTTLEVWFDLILFIRSQSMIMRINHYLVFP
jgi:hypothetical protein